MSKSDCELMKDLQNISFALDDVRLFLDTHPFETEALSYYQDCRTKRSNTLEEYSKNYGPILSYDVEEANQWTWVENPWPWEGEV